MEAYKITDNNSKMLPNINYPAEQQKLRDYNLNVAEKAESNTTLPNKIFPFRSQAYSSFWRMFKFNGGKLCDWLIWKISLLLNK